MDLDSFITRLYVLIDDWYKEEMSALMQRHAGAELKMSDSEVLTLAVVGQWRVGVPWQSERGLVRYMQLHGRQWFPKILQRSQFNKRVRDLWAVLIRLQQVLADSLETEDDLYEVVDCTELPQCSLAQASSHKRHWLRGKLGRGGNNGGWFYGEQILVSATATGVIRGWLSGLAPLDDRWMLEAFLSTRQATMQIIGPQLAAKKRKQQQLLPALETFSPALSVGQARLRPYLADKGFNGARWIEHWQEFYAVRVITAPPTNAPNEFDWQLSDEKWLSSHRQIIETVFARLSEVFGLKRLNAHSDWGKITRIAAKTAAYNFGIFLNRSLKRPDGALATLIQ